MGPAGAGTMIPIVARLPVIVDAATVAETSARLAELGEHLSFVTEMHGDGWLSLEVVITGDTIDRMAAGLVASEGRHDVAGSYLGSHLAGPVLTSTVAAVAHTRRCPDPRPEEMAVHLHADGWFDGVAFTGSRLAVLPDDPAAGMPGTVVVPDTTALRSWWARRTTDAVAPLLDAARRQLRYGRRGHWGAVADRVASTVLAVARHTGTDGSAAWIEAGALLDALGSCAPVPFTRPTPQPVTWSGGESWFITKGTCCLYYRTVEEADPSCGEGYCSTCPLVDAGARHARLTRWLEDPEGDD